MANHNAALIRHVEQLVAMTALKVYAAALRANGYRLVRITIETSAPGMSGLAVGTGSGMVQVETRKRSEPKIFIDEAADWTQASEEGGK